MMITLRELRNKLVPGVEFVGSHMRTGDVACRKVIGQSPKEMICQLLDGKNKGQLIYLQWKDMQATQSGDDIVITRKGDAGPFFKINILPKA